MARDSQRSLVEQGTQVGAYQLITQIGQGGMGEVWLAEHTLLRRRAAIKLLRPAISESDEMVTRFFNEARAATAISDPGIVQIFDFGHHADGSAYIVMELLIGEPLDKRLERVGAMQVDDALRIARQVASALGAAHERQIVHRDLKPENIFLVRDPEVPGGERAKILDFGIAKLTQDPFALKTQTSALIGTPMYMSPEQCRGAGHVDQRSDIYSIGCVLFTLLTGRAPFEAAGTGEMIAKHMCEAPPPASVFVMMPTVVEELLSRCLAKEPGARFENGAELAAAIEIVLARGRLSSPAFQNEMMGPPRVSQKSKSFPTISELPPRRATTTLSSAMMSAVTVPTRSNRAWIPIAVAIAVIGGFGSYLGLRPSASGTRAEPVPAAAAAVTATPLPASVPQPPVDHDAELVKRTITSTLSAFVRWSAHHAHDACPTAAQLEVDGGVGDPWGHALAITCTGQPSDQIIGVMSAGPDGVMGTRDDIESWRLGSDTTEIVRGSRWKPVTRTVPHEPAHPIATPAAVPPRPVTPPAAPKPVESPRPVESPTVKHDPTLHGTSIGADGIPTSR